MSAASITAALPDRPGSPPDPPLDLAAASAPAPSRTGRLFGLLRKLIDYGKDLANTLQQHTSATTTLFTIARRFGISCVETLTGFKYIGEKLGKYEAVASAGLTADYRSLSEEETRTLVNPQGCGTQT